MAVMKATLAACRFWCVEDVFGQMKGVKSTQVGYTEGRLKNPTYKDIFIGRTSHAEGIDIEFNPSEISNDEPLELFWSNRDQITLNGQGSDFGTQYRSAIFFYDKEQEAKTKESKELLQNSGRHDSRIVTEIKPASEFYKSEEYHLKYFQKCTLWNDRLGRENFSDISRSGDLPSHKWHVAGSRGTWAY